MNNKTDRREDLKSIGLKNTKHRVAILAIVEKQLHPIPAEQIFRELGQMGISVSLSTVYRELVSLVNNNLVNKIKINESRKALYEYNKKNSQHYIMCLSCKEMIPINVCTIKDFEKVLETQTHFRITEHKLNFFGYCLKCQVKGLPDKE
jgi:Fur family transcriptional regulator, ferric uptake regulator